MPVNRLRPLLAALLWLLVALLPLRSMATVWMQTSMAALPAAAVQAAGASSGLEAPPCHAAVLEESGTDNTAPNHAVCVMCDLCHSSAMPIPAFTVAPPPECSSVMLFTTWVGHERPLLDGLFRPPR